ncbi:hypothetical protein MNV49_001935 [Pseudohyphozyma bogoriensis]|nr:hypothetical protein MNV49_001935 [Pseudohyphozyma bogoriensis]
MGTAAVVDSVAPAPAPERKRSGFISYIWDTDYYLKSPEERRLVQKLDIMILTIVMSEDDSSSPPVI